MRFSAGIFIVGLLLTGTACNQETTSQLDEDLRLINQYITAKGLQNVQSTESGLHYIINEPGDSEGPFPTTLDTVTVNYEGRLLNDIIFDRGENFRTKLGDLVPGFVEGTQKIKEGGDITLIIPSVLGYGARSLPNIPSNSVLIFEVQVLKIERPE